MAFCSRSFRLLFYAACCSAIRVIVQFIGIYRIRNLRRRCLRNSFSTLNNLSVCIGWYFYFSGSGIHCRFNCVIIRRNCNFNNQLFSVEILTIHWTCCLRNKILVEIESLYSHSFTRNGCSYRFWSSDLVLFIKYVFASVIVSCVKLNFSRYIIII